MKTIDPPSSDAMLTPGPDAGAVTATLERGLRQFVRRAQARVGLVGEVGLLLTDDAEMRRLNRQYRGKRKTTDVLSFPAEAMPGLPAELQHAGDLAISVPVAAAQAAQFGHALGVELRVLALHGLLHLAGFDHEVDAGEMAAREAELRRELRLPVAGLIGRTMGAAAAEPAVAEPVKAVRRRAVAR